MANIAKQTFKILQNVTKGNASKFKNAFSPMVLGRFSRQAEYSTTGSALDILEEDDKLIAEAATNFAEKEIKPLVKAMDENHAFSKTLTDKMFKNGYMSMSVDPQYGGNDISFFQAVLVAEEFAKKDMATAIMAYEQSLFVGKMLEEWATEEQKQQFLTRLTTDTVGVFSLSEPGTGSDAFNLKTTAVQDGEHFVLNGTKQWASQSSEAGLFLLFANADPDKGYRGITCFIVERDMPGFTIGKPEVKLGMCATSTCPLYLENVRVPITNVLGGVCNGYNVAIKSLNSGRILIASIMLGLAQGCMDCTVPYLFEREAYGKIIWRFQALQHQVARVQTEIQAARLLVYNAARKHEAGLSINMDAAMAKFFASEVAGKTTSQCIDWMGGVGVIRDYPQEKFYRDCKIGSIIEGTTNIQLNTIAKSIAAQIKEKL